MFLHKFFIYKKKRIKINDYTIMTELGKGSYGDVRLIKQDS